MGRWSATHWKTATFGWLAFVVVAFGIGGMVGMKTIDADAPGPGESGRMDRILDAGFPQPAGENVLDPELDATGERPAFTSRRRATSSRRSRSSTSSSTSARRSLPRTRARSPRTGTRRSSSFEIRGDPDTAVDQVGPVLDRVDELQKAHPQLFIGQFGDASKVDAVVTAYGNDLGKAGLLSLPVTLIILLVAFGALVAAGIPLLLALTAVFATFGLIAIPSHVFPVAMQAPRARAPDRARGRRRLLDVLLEARTRGAGRGTKRTGGARGRRGDVRPLGARRRPDRDRRRWPACS